MRPSSSVMVRWLQRMVWLSWWQLWEQGNKLVNVSKVSWLGYLANSRLNALKMFLWDSSAGHERHRL